MSLKEKLLSQKQLKELFYYDPETGHFTRLTKTAKRVKIGELAGGDNGFGYLQIRINGELYLSHRLACLYMTGKWPEFTDHINHIRSDNRWINLREVTCTENHKNMTLRADNLSGVIGVCFCNRDKAWLSYINVEKKRKPLGYFKDKFEAICARMSANNKYNFHENHGR